MTILKNKREAKKKISEKNVTKFFRELLEETRSSITLYLKELKMKIDMEKQNFPKDF